MIDSIPENDGNLEIDDVNVVHTISGRICIKIWISIACSIITIIY